MASSPLDFVAWRYLNAGLPVISLDTKKREILDRFYETGLKLPTFIRDTLRIRFDRLLPLWNYVVLPAPDAKYWEVI